MLHDIAKIAEFSLNSTGLVEEYSVKGNLLGHIPMGAMIIDGVAKELGINGANNTEVNCKIASQGESKYSKETMNRKHRFVNPQESENHRY